MKKITTLALVLGFSTQVFAQLSTSEQFLKVEDIAKGDRREMWIGGYEEVSSQVEKPTKKQIDEFISGNRQLANPLASDEIASIYRCFNSPKKCQVYTIDLYAEMYGGAGSSRRWVLLNPNNGSYESILHSVYEE
jgi:hypothetical protein